jgi:hypothetical protein
MDEDEREALIRDLQALFARWRRLGYFDGYEPGPGPGDDLHG